MRTPFPQLHLLVDWLRPKKPIAVRRKRVARQSSSDPELKSLWNQIQEKHFPDKPELQLYSVYWSTRRQKRVLASCNIRGKKVSVARELQDPLFHEWLDPLLYHEMCHAYIGEDVPRSGRKRLWHGALFKDLEQRHPRIPALEAWIKEGGWLYAVRRDRGKRSR